MIHKVGNEFVISAYGSWRPGAYDSERAARYAFRFSDEALQSIQDGLKGGSISFETLKSLKAVKQ